MNNRWDEQADVMAWAHKEKVGTYMRMLLVSLAVVGLLAFTAGIFVTSVVISHAVSAFFEDETLHSK